MEIRNKRTDGLVQGIISIKDALAMHDTVFIDVRSEGEYAEDHVPNAINLPIFNNEERAELGKVYKHEGIEKAKYLGLQIVSPKLPDLYQKALTYKDKNIILYCWRGGMRSKSVQAIFAVMGLRPYRLEGGYKAYRRFVNNYFDRTLSFETVVMHGLTGVGKTELIQKLREKQINAIDLEGLANNRGSSYGSVAMPLQPTQKYFETKLFTELVSLVEQQYVIMECESKRIGKVFLPGNIFEGMKKGKHILIYDSIANRIKRIIDEYAKYYEKDTVLEQLLTSTENLQKKLGKKVVSELKQLILANNLEPVVEYLLINYYDPLYKYPDAPSNDYDLSVNMENIEKASEVINDFIRTTYFLA